MRHVVTFYDDVGEAQPEFKVRGPFDFREEADAYADGMEYVADSAITDIKVAPYSPEKHGEYLYDQSLGYPPESEGEVFTGVEVSTANITKADADILEELARKNDGPYTVAAYEYGFFVTTLDPLDRDSETLEAMERQGLSMAFRRIVSLWGPCGKRVLLIDRDAAPAEGLERFDW
jgi:hypothetical protein